MSSLSADFDADEVPKLKPPALSVDCVVVAAREPAGRTEPNPKLGFIPSPLEVAPAPGLNGDPPSAPATGDPRDADNEVPIAVFAAPNTPGAFVDIGGADDEELMALSFWVLGSFPPNENDGCIFSSFAAPSLGILDFDADCVVESATGAEPNPKLGFTPTPLEVAPVPKPNPPALGAAAVLAASVDVDPGVVPKVNLGAAPPPPVLAEDSDPKVFFEAAPPKRGPPEGVDELFSSDLA